MVYYVILAIVTFAAFMTKGATGFGNTLVMDSALSFIESSRLITPLDLLFSIPANAYVAWRERKSVRARTVIPLALFSLAGTIPGAFLLKTAEDKALKAVLGLIIVALALEMRFRKTARANNRGGVAAVIVGVVSGLISGVYGIGALMAAYIGRTCEDRGEFRGNACLVFFTGNLFRLAIYGATGILTARVIYLALALSPVAAAGLYAGIKINSRVNDKTAMAAVSAVLLVSGGVLFLKNVL